MLRAMEPVLRTEGLTRAFGRVKAVDGLSLCALRGEVYGFLGRNGAGKTTTLRLLMGILSAGAGRIELFGEPVRKVSLALKRRLGYVSQEQHFYPWMTAADLGHFVGALFPTWDDAEYLRLLARFDVPRDRNSSALSGGTRAKLALALALAHRPPLLLLDEPTAGLDPYARREFLDLLLEEVRAAGRSVFFSSHLVDEVERVSQRVGILQDGRMRVEEPVPVLLAQVRRLSLPEGAPWPEGLARVHGDIARGLPEAWEALPPDATASALTLEDVFLAYARRGADT